jgi:murein DD-endopeptidase MepM/ murein hydrolase activator NlpD
LIEAMDDRRLTFIIVPHGDLETKTFEISYRKLRLIASLTVGVVICLLVMVAFWFSMAANAARVRPLLKEISSFEADRAKVDSLARLLAEVEGQYAKVRQLLGSDGPVDGRQPVLPELRTKRDSANELPVIDGWPLGTVRGYITREPTNDANHPGLDIAVQQSTYIRAAGAGKVVEAGNDSVYGNFIRIDHGSGLETLYAHASQLLVATGKQVARLEMIALSGNTGRSTAPHLHFEVRQNGVPVDPRRYVRQP